jgi:hypothetical protein
MSSAHEEFNRLSRLGLLQRSQPLRLGLVPFGVSLRAFGRENAPMLILSGTRDSFQPLRVSFGPPLRR